MAVCGEFALEEAMDLSQDRHASNRLPNSHCNIISRKNKFQHEPKEAPF